MSTLIRGYDAPMHSASATWDIRRGSRKSSSSTAPGCVGAVSLGSLMAAEVRPIADDAPAARRLGAAPFLCFAAGVWDEAMSVVVCDLDTRRTLRRPVVADSVLVVDSDR